MRQSNNNIVEVKCKLMVVGGENDLDLNAVGGGGLEDFLGVRRINGRSFFSGLINNPAKYIYTHKTCMSYTSG